MLFASQNNSQQDRERKRQRERKRERRKKQKVAETYGKQKEQTEKGQKFAQLNHAGCSNRNRNRNRISFAQVAKTKPKTRKLLHINKF